MKNISTNDSWLAYQAIFDSPAMGIVMVNGCIIERCNAYLGDIYACDRNEFIGEHISTLLAFQSDYSKHFNMAAEIIRCGGIFKGEVQARRKDGRLIWIKGTGRAFDVSGNDLKIVWIIEDVTQLRQTELALHETQERLESQVQERTRHLESALVQLRQDLAERTRAEQRSWHAAHHDALTGLANRIVLNDRLAYAISAAHRKNGTAGLMYIDLDRFKNINDTLGHDVGDSFLCEIARRLQQAVRAMDLVARIGGDEFVILMPELSQPCDARVVARKIQEVLRADMHIGSHILKVTASIGISQFPLHGNDGETLLRNADIAMYRAKAKGRDAIQIFENGTSDTATAESML